MLAIPAGACGGSYVESYSPNVGPNDAGQTVKGGGLDIGAGIGFGLDTQVTYTEELWRGDIWDLIDPWGLLPCH
jgi:hypothetical protein